MELVEKRWLDFHVLFCRLGFLQPSLGFGRVSQALILILPFLFPNETLTSGKLPRIMSMTKCCSCKFCNLEAEPFVESEDGG